MLQSNWNKIGYFSLGCGFIVCFETLRPILLKSLVLDNVSMLPLRFKSHLERRCFQQGAVCVPSEENEELPNYCQDFQLFAQHRHGVIWSHTNTGAM